MKYKVIYFVLLLFLTGCGEQRNTQSYAATPSRPAAAVLPVALPAPTSIVSDKVTINQFVHSSSRFSINYPDNWRVVERSDSVLLVDPGDNGGYTVFFAEAAQHYDANQLKQYLAQFMAETLIYKPDNFTLLNEKQLPDGSTVAQFQALDPTFGQTINEVHIFQRETIIFIVLISTSQAQWSISHPQLAALANSLMPLDTAPMVAVTATPVPPTWLLTGPTSHEFAFLYPSDWQILLQEAHLVSVRMPETEIVFTANNYVWAEDDQTNLAQKAAATYLKKLKEKFANVKESPPADFAVDTLDGVNIDFTYRTKKIDMAGSLITAAADGKIYQIIFTTPITDYQAGLNWFNPMYQSFKILNPADITPK